MKPTNRNVFVKPEEQNKVCSDFAAARKCRIRSSLFILLAFLLIADQATKFLVKLNMTIGESIGVFGDWFQIYFIENQGAAFGMLSGGAAVKIILTLFRVVAIAFLVYYIIKLTRQMRTAERKVPTGLLVGLIFVTAGAAGNLIDSLFYGIIFSESTFTQVAQLFPDGGGYAPFLQGKVVDMLYFPLIRNSAGETIFFSPIFNVADSYITCGFVYLLLFQRKFFSK